MSDPVLRELTGFPLWRLHMRNRLAMFRRRWIPYLVWANQPVWVRVTFTEARLPVIEGTFEEIMAKGIAHINSGHMAKIESDLHEIGISFDKGAGPDGRDWEWDWSLHGPIEVRFAGKGGRKG